jgi:hypothetical protein
MNVNAPRKRLKRFLRPLVRRTLSPRTVQRIQFRWWSLSHYVPWLLISQFSKRNPKLHTFGAVPTAPNLVKRLQDLNILAPTRMCRVMSKWGSDKGRNHYTTVYSALFKDRCEQPIKIFELGLGTNNPDAPSNMGVFGAPGASHRGWRELFPNAHVYGADIDRQILFQEDRINTFYCDQLDGSSIRELWSHADLMDGADIIIEDGLHTFEANISFLEESLHHLRPGGIYVIEDIESECIENWCARIETVYSKRYPKYGFAFVVLANPGSGNMLVAGRGGD